jgi:hypothetical protein
VEIGDVDDEAVALVVYHRFYLVHVYAFPHLIIITVMKLLHRKLKKVESEREVIERRTS